MQRKRYTEEQIIQVLKEGEAGASVADLSRKYGMSDASYYNWKAKYRYDGQQCKSAEGAGSRKQSPKAESFIDTSRIVTTKR